MSIYKLQDHDGAISTRALPSGDLALTATGEDLLLRTCREIAKQFSGTWNEQYRNWIVKAQHRAAAEVALTARCQKIA